MFAIQRELGLLTSESTLTKEQRKQADDYCEAFIKTLQGLNKKLKPEFQGPISLLIGMVESNDYLYDDFEEDLDDFNRKILNSVKIFSSSKWHKKLIKYYSRNPLLGFISELSENDQQAFISLKLVVDYDILVEIIKKEVPNKQNKLKINSAQAF